MTESVPTTNFSASWIRIDQTSDPSFYSALLDATRARGLDQARRDPAAVLGPLDLRPGLRVLDVGWMSAVGPATTCASWPRWSRRALRSAST